MTDKQYIGGAENPTIRRVREAVEPVIEAEGLTFVGTEMGREGSRAILWVYIDKSDGVTIDDCARVSPEVSAALDVDDPITERYEMRVSSPGLDRPLMSNLDFEAAQGEEVSIQLATPMSGRRKFTGVVEGIEGAEVAVKCADGAHRIPLSFIQKARIRPQFKMGQKK